MNQSLNLLARILMAAIFIISGIGKITGFREAVHMAAATRLPAPEVAIACAAAIELLCGAALLLGWRVALASLVLFLYLIPVTILFHASKAGQSHAQLIEVLKNLAIMGGLLRFYLSSLGARLMPLPSFGRRAA